MQLFKLIDLQSNIANDYEGFHRDNDFWFVSTDDPADTLFLTEESDGAVLFKRVTKDIAIDGILRVNRICSLGIILKEQQLSGSMPVLVRVLKINFPDEIRITYHMLDEKNVPIETCEVLVSEKK